MKKKSKSNKEKIKFERDQFLRLFSGKKYKNASTYLVVITKLIIFETAQFCSLQSRTQTF